ncbi:MAG: BamA/TamA family outer membrane protein [candidate division Zixibacteria bacterium]|nr:BamA/TamA family outer membrane protein [candidate division Zixibacteria bacterium]
MLRRSFIIIILSLICFFCAASISAQSAYKRDKLYRSWLADEPYISIINIEGNEFFSDSKIRSRLYSRTNSIWQSLKSGSRNKVLRYTVNRDTLEVQYLYLKEGFLNIIVNEQVEVYPVDSSAIIYISINEGRRFIIGEVRLTINDSLPFARTIRDLAHNMRVGEPVNPVKLNTILFSLKTVCSNNGYPYAEFIHKIDSSLGPQNTKIFITGSEGPFVRFGDVLIDSLRIYSPELARREITFKKGEPYSREKIFDTQKRLYRTGLFNSINLDFSKKNGGNGKEKTLDINPDFRFSAIERKAHYIALKTGASQDSLQDLTWDFSTSWGKRNIFTSRRVEFSINSRFVIFTDWRIIRHRYQMRFTDPWFAGFRLPITLTARFEPGVRSQIQDYRIQKWLLALSTRKEWSEQFYAVFSGEYENVNIYAVSDIAAAEIKNEQEISVRRKFTAVIVRDTRIDKFVPKSGSYTTYFTQYVGGFLGGDDSFLKFEFSWARYQPGFASIIYATRLKGGWVKEFGSSSEVPLNDRFYLGGANSIRGFDENSIGPRVTEYTINPNDSSFSEQTVNVGSNAYFIFNQEFRFPLFWKFWGSTFVDIGNGFESLSDLSPDKLLFSYGAGLQFMSPAGPLRLDYAYRLDREGYGKGDRWHITILYAF